MSETDGSSEDDDYKPTKKEIDQAEADKRQKKRQKTSETAVAQPKAAKANIKVEEIWKQLHNSGKSGSGGQLARRNVSLAALCRGEPPSADREWMRQLGIASKPMVPAPVAKPPRRETDPATEAPEVATASMPGQEKVSDLGMAARALAAAKVASSSTGAQHVGQVHVTEIRRFAGKDVQVSKLATAEEAERHKEAEQNNKAGLDAVLESLQGTKRVNVLDKSRDDWGKFKREDTNVEEELEAYKKSGGKYLDKVDFLKRAELREYEAEREKKLSGDIRSRGRI